MQTNKHNQFRSQSDPLNEKSNFGLASTTFGCRPLLGPPFNNRGSDESGTSWSISKFVVWITLWSLYVVLLIDATINFSSRVSSVNTSSWLLFCLSVRGLLFPLLWTVGRFVSNNMLCGVIGIFSTLRAKISLSLSILFKRFKSATYDTCKSYNFYPEKISIYSLCN